MTDLTSKDRSSHTAINLLALAVPKQPGRTAQQKRHQIGISACSVSDVLVRAFCNLAAYGFKLQLVCLMVAYTSGCELACRINLRIR